MMTDDEAREALLLHARFHGTAYPADQRWYCTLCVHTDGPEAGRSVEYPCSVVLQAVRILRARRQEALIKTVGQR